MVSSSCRGNPDLKVCSKEQILMPVDEMPPFAQLCGQPLLDDGLINGANFLGTGNHTDGAPLKLQVAEGKSYRLRLVNAALDMAIELMIDYHNMAITAMGLVPIKPYTTYSLTIRMVNDTI
ncbi:hypothetical protein BDV36DRAFT_242914 [Aspergillus pseudocaelatus]|uniref:Plastocyanin-like domain-containing protein n=1 Tax=Aspergillus pseudocaelatus TaxID=1825620 RepID=A0ABQ6X2Q3_9EURO|nr:hypothetical protein BDV36DRAFT_242914 [Aspergillus pseudocaelatus]